LIDTNNNRYWSLVNGNNNSSVSNMWISRRILRDVDPGQFDNFQGQEMKDKLVKKKKKKRKAVTSKSRIKAVLHGLWLRSNERATALKRDGYTCQECGKKQSKTKGAEQKVQVHHLNGIEWDKIIEYIYRHILVDPKHLETICPDCHDKLHRGLSGVDFDNLPF
jgi:hypothetical protein